MTPAPTSVASDLTPDSPFTSMTPTLCRRLSALLSITAVLVIVVCIRLAVQQRRVWFPAAPLTLGDWTATEVPLDHVTLDMLGDPPADDCRAPTPFGEHVESQIIATTSYAAYHEPAICMAGYGFTQTAFKTMSILGPGRPVRALILKSQTTGERILMYYWVQYKDGSTSGQNQLSLHQDLLPRFTVGWQKALNTKPSCIVRAYITMHPADRQGLQARRNLDAVCQGLYESLKRDGTHS